MRGVPPVALRAAGGWPAPIAALLLAAWLGAALYFSVVVTRAAFAVLPSRDLAGALVGRTLPVLFDGGMFVGIWLIATVLLSPRTTPRAASLGGGIAMAALCAFARFAILTRITRLRLAMPAAIDTLSPNDPARRAFGQLHALSVGALGLSLIIGLAVLIALAYSLAVVVHD
jgi:hypothetical protein